MNTSIIAIGYCGLDRLCLLPRIPIDDKVKIDEYLEQGGGPAATAAFTAARLGIKTAFVGAVGDDSVGSIIRKSLEAVGIDTQYLITRPDSTSPIGFCWVDQQTGKRSIAWTHGNAMPLEAGDIPLAAIRDADAIHLDGHQGDAALEAAERASHTATHVSLDAGTIVPNIERLLELSDIVIASEKFAATMTGLGDPKEAVKQLFGMGFTSFAGVTLGEKGSIGYDGKQFYFQPSFKVDVKDTTGAGDTYHGAFLASYVKCLPPQECMRRAAAAAAIKCTALGGRTAIPDMLTLEQFLKQHK